MSTVNDTGSPESTDHPESPDRSESPTHPESIDRSESPDAEEPTTPADRPESDATSVYVRRGRTPTLGFWVALALVVPAAAALLAAPFFQFQDLSSVLNFMLVAAVFVGLPLAAIAALVDALRHRDRKRRRR